MPPRFALPTLLRFILLPAALLLWGCGGSPGAPGRSAAPAGEAAISDPALQVARSPGGVVASASVYATEVGARVLAEGGNAVDAAVATAFALAVTEPSMSGLGGRTSLIIRAPDGSVHGIDGLNQVPRGYRSGSGAPEGYERAAIPGVPAALVQALEAHGTWPLQRVVAPAIRLAEEGFVLTPDEAGRWAGAADDLGNHPAALGTYLRQDGTPWQAGDRVVNRLLGRTLRGIASGGVGAFYGGWIADSIHADMARNGGFILREELAAYRALPAIPVLGEYRGHTLASNFRPASGHTVIQALQSMEGLAVPGRDDPAGWAAVVGQAMHYALGDRSRREGTEEESARFLTSREHARARGREIVLPGGGGMDGAAQAARADESAAPEPADPGAPAAVLPREVERHAAATRSAAGGWIPVGLAANAPAAVGDLPRGTLVVGPTDREATTHLAAADGRGMVVSLTQSLGPSMGTRLVASGLGFLYATRLGSEPGSRPGSTIAPTIVFRGDAPAFALGGAGDARIISAVIQVISRVVDHGMTLEEAVAAPRVHPDGPRALRVEEGPVGRWSDAERQRLEAWGFEVQGAPSGFFGRVHAVQPSAGPGEVLGVAEPRWRGGTAGPLR
jgi:gamma-glutamyltranspeptidase / glutathione hydrolase